MKTFVSVSIILTVALAAPIKDEEVSGPKRVNKSPSYRPPDGSYIPALAPAPESLYGPVPSSYGHAQTPVSSPIIFHLPSSGNMPSALHYRKNEHPWKLMMYSDDKEHLQARSYGCYGPAAGAIAGGATQAAVSGPAIGLFPNANIRGSNPLLFSCAPSISKGQIMKSQYASYTAPSYGYRNMNFNTQMRIHEVAMQKAAEQQAQWSEMDHAAAATGMGHMHQRNSDAHASYFPNDLNGYHMHLLYFLRMFYNRMRA